MSSNKKSLFRNSVSVDLGCSCRKLNLSHIFRPKSRQPKPQNNRINKSSSTFYTRTTNLCNSSSTSSWGQGSTFLSLDDDDEQKEDKSNTTFGTYSEPETDYCYDPDNSSSKKMKKKKKKNVCEYGRISESLAIEKDSDDPYLDFRHSMLQMILEKEIYSKDELRKLLECFLSLNSPHHHEIIVRAFTEIWSGVFSLNSSVSCN